MKYIKLFLLSVVSLVTISSHAAVSPLGLAIVPPVQLPTEDFTITGARINLIYGNHRGMYGFDFGAIGNVTTQNFVGIGVAGIFNSTAGIATIVGLQLAGITNINKGKASIYGAQITLGINSNQAESSLVGLQVGVLSNYSPHTTVTGLQLGIYNSSRAVYGFQIGLVNSTEHLHGIQIGLLNFNKQGLFAVAPILNIGF